MTTTRRPRSDWIMRRFMRGEDVEHLAYQDSGLWRGDLSLLSFDHRVGLVEAALRKVMLRTEKRYTMKTKALRHKIETMKETSR